MRDHVDLTPSHTEGVFNMDQFPCIVENTVKVVKKLKVDAIAVSGHSGLILGGAVSFLTKIPLIAVRKINEKPKADSRPLNVFSHRSIKNWVILDDTIADGETMARIIFQLLVLDISERVLPKAVILYSQNRTDKSFFIGDAVDSPMYVSSKTSAIRWHLREFWDGYTRQGYSNYPILTARLGRALDDHVTEKIPFFYTGIDS